MKLTDVLTEDTKPGTYAGVHFDQETIDKIIKYIKENDIPNPVPKNKLHTTLLYSRKYLPDFKAEGKLDKPMSGTPDQLVVWETNGKERNEPTSRCLILKYKCPELVKRHDFLMDTHKATYDFPEYIPHVTLSYDIGDMDIEELPDPKKTIDQIVIVEEYQETLNLDWAKQHGKDK